MPIDPNIALGFRQPEQPNMLGQMAQVMAIKAAQQEMEGNAGVNQLARKGVTDPNEYLQYGSQGRKTYESLLKGKKEKLESDDKRNVMLGGLAGPVMENPTPETFSFALDRAVNFGLMTPEQKQQTIAQYGGSPESIKAYSSQIFKGSINAQAQQVNATSIANNEATNKTRIQAANISAGPAYARLKAESAAPELTPQSVDMAANVYIQTGQLPPLGIGKSSSALKTAILNRATQLQMGSSPSTPAVPNNSTSSILVNGTAPVTNNLSPTTTAPPVNALVPKTAEEAANSVINNKIDNRANAATVKAFTSGTEARRVTALNTAIAHLNTMNDLAEGLQNGDARLINSAANAIAKQTGAAAPTNLAAAKQIVGAEIIKAIVANGGTGRERLEAEEKLAAANSPEQFAGVIKTYQELMTGQLDSLRTQYKGGTGRNDFNDKFLTPESKKVFLNRESAAAASSDGTQTPAPAAASSGAVSVPLPNGKSFSFPNAEEAAKFKKAAGL